MKIKINGQLYTFPIGLHQVTLQQRVGYDKEHGQKLKEQLKKIIEIKNPVLQDMDFSAYQMDMACRTVSYFGRIPLATVQQTFMDDIFALYMTYLKLVTEETDFSKPEAILHEFEWKGDTWQIHPVQLEQNSRMNFDEFIDAKQIVQNLYELAEEKWEALLYLCCIFLRKKDEPYSKELAVENGPRFKLMLTLPLDKALNVGFFLSSLINTYLTTSPFSGHLQESQGESQ